MPLRLSKCGVFYFSRRIPEDLLSLYQTNRVVMSLKTKSVKIARIRSAALAAKLEEDWITLRWKNNSDPFHRYLKDQQSITVSLSSAPMLSEAKGVYIKGKGKDRSKTFEQAIDRAIGYLIKLHGDKPIDTYTRVEANALRDAFVERGLRTNTIKRIITSIRAIINFTCKELGLDEIRTFSGLLIDNEAKIATKKRLPIPTDVMKKVLKECQELNDQPRWIVALVSDTGMRLSEAVGLVKGDVVLENNHPYLRLTEHPWRRLKSKSSERIVPLAGNSLWAVKQALNATDNEFLFPKYCSEKGSKGNSASAALNKWLSYRVPKGCVMHSFRHSMRDRLRAVECPTTIIDRLGGWSVEGVVITGCQ